MKMKFLPLFLLFFFILLTHAQRRTTAKPAKEAEPIRPTPSRGRGRSRYTASAEYQNVKDVSSSPDLPSKKTVPSRRRVVENVEQKFSSVTTAPQRQFTKAASNAGRRLPSPTFSDTAEKIFTINDNRRTVRPQSTVNSRSLSENAVRTSKPLTDYVERRNFKSGKNSYEVQEVIDEDFELVRRSKNPRVISDTSFKAANIPARNQDNAKFSKTSNFPKRNQDNIKFTKVSKRVHGISETTKSLDIPRRNQDDEEITKTPAKPLLNSIALETPAAQIAINENVDAQLVEQVLDTTLSPDVPVDAPTVVEPKEKITKTQPVSSTAKPIEVPRNQGGRRNALRKNQNIVLEQSTSASRFRTRGRSTQPNQALRATQETESTSVSGRGFRRKLDTLVEPRKGPSVFAADSQVQETRSRTGRKIEILTPDKLNIDVPVKNRRRTTSTTPISSSTPTFPSRNRFRSREMPFIDEQKLEVLPLFEEEPKLVRTKGSNRAESYDFKLKKSESKKEKPTTSKYETDDRSRRREGLEMIEMSASETESTFSKSTISPSKSRVSVSVSVETRTESSFKRPPSKRKTEVKESVVSEINEVTSRRKVLRKKVIPVNANRTKEIKPVGQTLPTSRGSKKSDVVIKKESSEEIGEADNYPEAFKALIKSRKGKKESRSSVASLSRTKVSNIVTFSTSTAYPLTTKEINENDNELKPKPLTTNSPLRWNTRSRFTSPSSVKKLLDVVTERKLHAKTTTHPTTSSTTPLSRVTKYRTLTPRVFSSPPKLERTVSFKPRNVGNEKTIEIKRYNRAKGGKKSDDPVLLTTKVPKYLTTSKKLDRSKYRGFTTTPPKYIPTIPSVPYVPTVPTINPPRIMVETTPHRKDDDAGLQVISIDEPVNVIQSANLVNGEFISSTAKSVPVPLPLVRDGTTEKTVSIIERIINSISAISTTSTPNAFSTSTVSTTESPSAILKLSPKKSRQTDVTDATKQINQNGVAAILTTENPTTIIERILSSLNAIQATDNTSSVQVGTDFNTLSSFTTTPLPSVTKSSTSNSPIAPSSTTVIPLSILDELNPEEFTKQETIRRLLDMLSGLVSTPQVVVTPKNVNKQIGRGPSISTTILPQSTYFSEFTTVSKLSTVPTVNIEDLSSDFVVSEAPEVTSIAPSSKITITSEGPTSTLSSTEQLSTLEATTSETPSSTMSTLSSTELLSSSEATSTETPFSTISALSSTELISTSEAIATKTPSSTLSENVSTSSTETFSTESTTRSIEVDKTTVGSLESTTTVSTTTDPQILSTTESSTTEFTTTESSSTESSTTELTASFPTVTEAVNFYTILSTLSPFLQKFEVSPESVSIISANDISSNSVILDDNILTTIATVNIAGRSNFDNSATTQSTTTESATFETTTLDVTTEAPIQTSSGPMESSTPTVNITLTNRARSERLLNFVQDPIENRIDASTPDYFIFAVLNNNTILRKKPPVVPKASYYVIGVYPNNTVVKKYPNGTIVPMEMTIRVRGFDTRENPPPLPDIISNQVTSDPGSPVDNKIVKTDEQNTIPTIEVKPLNLVASSSAIITSTSTSTIAQSTTLPSTTTTSAPTSIQSTTTQPTTTSPSTIFTVVPSTTQPKIFTSTISMVEQSTTAQPTTTTPFTSKLVLSTTIEPITSPPSTITTTVVVQSTTNLPTTTTSIIIPTKEQISTTLSSANAPAPTLSVLSNTISQDTTSFLSTTDSVSTKLTSTEISTIAPRMSEDLVTVESSTVFSTTMESNSNTPTFATLSELFNGKTLEAFNEIVNSDKTNTNTSNQTDTGRVNKYLKVLNIRDLIKGRSADSWSGREPNKVDTTPLATSTFAASQSPLSSESTTVNVARPSVKVDTFTEDSIFLSNRILEETTRFEIPTPLSAIQKIGPTQSPKTTTFIPDVITQTSRKTTTTPPTIPTFLTTFFPNLFKTETTKPPTTKQPGVIRISAAPSVTKTGQLAAFTTRPTTTRPTTVTQTRRTNPPTTTMLTSTMPTTAVRYTTTPATITTTRPTVTTQTIKTTTRAQTTTTARAATAGETVSTDATTEGSDKITDFNTIEITTKSLKLKELTPQQKKDLKAIAQLEKEQAALLQQLSFLTNLGIGSNRNKKPALTTKTPTDPKTNSDSSLAERIIALAVERDKAKTTTTSTVKPPTSIQDQLAAIETTRIPKKVTPVLNEVLKQYNLDGITVSSPTSGGFGKSEDAILASILKEQGIVPSTPKVLAGIFDETTIRPRPRPRTTTTPQPGPIMRSLNWLLNALAPPPAPVVTRRPVLKPKKLPVEDELLLNSPTQTTRIVTAAPSKIANALSQDDIQKLIKQLEGIQKNPSKESLDLSQIKSIQNLINIDEGVVISANGEHGTTSRRTTTLPTTVQIQTTARQPKKLVTANPVLAVSNNVEEFEPIESTTRTLRAPIGFNPVPGVDDDSPNTLVRSNLITAAVNVTRAISSFLGTALQGAAASFQSLFGVSQVGTRVLGTASGGSSSAG